MRRPARAALLLLVPLAPLVGCGEPRRVTEADCAQLGARLQAAWTLDARAALAAAEAEADAELVRAVGEQGARVAQGSAQACREKLMGRGTAAGELECLRRARHIDEVYACAHGAGTATGPRSPAP
ncbi:MAG: hypothetical protein HY744_21045 [Deltaproteobacteria bacterium]|nr:hypothetical protein [Deltaproteobacteria bacterium]